MNTIVNIRDKNEERKVGNNQVRLEKRPKVSNTDLKCEAAGAPS